MKVELIYDADCPNVAAARSQLLTAFARAGLDAQWSEWDRGRPESPGHVRGYGSPTILVDGRDVAGAEHREGIACCRLYGAASGEFQGAPSVEMVTSALTAAPRPMPQNHPGRGSGWRSSLAAVPGIGASLLPAGICPACWPAYAGLLSALGMGFLFKTAYLLSATALFLLIAVGALAFRARARRGYGPFVLGLIASTVILVGKFLFASNAAMYVGICLLVAASLWNAWPRQAAKDESGACPACAPEGRVS